MSKKNTFFQLTIPSSNLKFFHLFTYLTVISLFVPYATASAQDRGNPTLNPKITQDTTSSKPLKTANPTPVFEPFTGKLNKTQVRLRLQPSYDAPIARELNRNDLVLITGETEDFYAVLPPPETKGYVFRTFVLDNVIEGNRVNIRLKPDLDAPVISQLNAGDKVEGTIYPNSNKWLEIKLPPSARFYIAKEFIEKAGDAGYIARMEKRKEDVYRLLRTTEAVSNTEMQKSFDQINLNGVKANYQQIAVDYTDFPEAGIKAKELLNQLQDAYASKKMAYLEEQANHSTKKLQTERERLTQDLKQQQAKIADLQQLVEKQKESAAFLSPSEPSGQEVLTTSKKNASPPLNQTAWLPQEQKLYALWSQQASDPSLEAFYAEQKNHAITLKGVVDPYLRPVKNKPGDYMLIDPTSRIPLAYLYSTQINLQDYAGSEVKILAAERPNCNYAFPAYFVLEIE